MLKAYYDRWYAPNNAILVIVGDVEPVAVLAQVKSLFGGIPRKELHEQPSIHPRPGQTQTIEGKTDRANGMVVAAFRLPGFDSADYAALNLLSDVMSSQRVALYALTADGKALGTDAEGDFLPHAGLAYLVAEFRASVRSRAGSSTVQPSASRSTSRRWPHIGTWP